MKLLIDLDEKYVNAIDKIKFLVGGRTDRKLQLEIIKAIKNGVPLDQEPTTKNCLGVDCISRKRVLEWLENATDDSIEHALDSDLEFIPSVTPQEPQSFEWCETCKEYDQEKHCCHRWTKVIRNTVEEMKQEYIEREVLDELRAEITTLQNRCYALTKGTMCAFCRYECEYKAENNS